jgi:cytochrome c-type biogenesis protein CcmF
VAHLGVAMFDLGVSVTKSFSDDRDIALSPGNSAKVGQYDVHFISVRNVEGPNYTAVEGEISIKDKGKEVAVLHPQKRMYRVQQNVLTEAGILSDWHRHVSVSMGDSLGNNAWSMRLMYRPMLRFVWLGCLVMAFGGFIAAFDRRYRRVTASDAAIATGEAARST